MRTSPIRALAPVLALLALTTCVDGGTEPDGDGTLTASVALRPVFASTSTASQAQDINRIRVRVLQVPGNTVLGTLVVDVDPNAQGWTLDVEFELPSGSDISVIMEVELINVAATSGVETVEFSGRVGPFDVQPGQSSTVQSIEVVRGPLENLDVTGVTISPDPVDPIAVDGTAQLTASVQSSGTSTPIVFWTSLEASVATVDANGLVTGLAPGTARIVAEAGTVADTVVVTVLEPPSVADLQLAKEALQTTAVAGDAVDFLITLLNLGPDPAGAVEVLETLPTGLTLLSATPSAGSFDAESGVWSLAGLEVGATVTLLVQTVVAPDALGVLANAAVIQSSELEDPDPSNDAATAEVLVEQASADLAVSKSVDDAVPSEGDTITYTVVVTNSGPGDAPDVTVQDALPDGLATVSVTTSRGNYDVASGLWTIGPQLAGRADTLRIRARVLPGTAGQTIVNTAGVVGAALETDPNPDNDEASAALSPTVETVDLSLAKVPEQAAANVGDTATFVVTLKNAGPGLATGVVVEDVLPAGLTLAGASASQGSYDAATGLWSVGSLAAGDSATLSLKAVVQASVQGESVTNTATVVAVDQEDTNAANDTASTTVLVLDADLILDKDVDDTTPNVLSNVTFTITVSNAGPNRATGVEVTDVLPAGLTFVSATASAGSYDETTGLWTVGDVGTDQPETLDIVAKVEAELGGQTVTNTAAVTAVDQPDDPLPTASVSLDVQAIDVSVTKIVDDAAPTTGATVVFTVTALNSGPSDATGVEIVDVLPAGLTFVSATTSAGTYDQTTGTWTVGTLTGGGGSQSLTLSASVDVGTAGQTITNTATLTAIDQIDGNPANDVGSAAITVQALADVEITKVSDVTVADVGDAVTFTITANNLGPDGVTNLVVSDALPAGLSFSSATPTQGTYDSGTGAWSAGALASGSQATLTLVATVDAGQAGATISNTASVASLDATDPDPSNDAASAGITVTAIDLQAAKIVDRASPSVTQTVTYTVTLTNNGPDAATNVVVADALPAGVTFVSATPTAGAYTAPNWTVPTLASGASETLTLQATVDTGTEGTTITNTATVTASDQEDTNAANDAASVDIVPRPVPVAVSYTTAGNTQLIAGSFTVPATPHATDANGVLATTPSLNVTSLGPFASTNGGTVTMTADGSFSYVPLVGDGTTDTFDYTVDTGLTATVTVTITGMVWYVNNTAGTTGNGLSNDPFDFAFDAFNATADNDGSTVFLHRGSGGAYLDTSLRAGQTLVGEGVELVVGGLSLNPAGTATVLSSTEGSALFLNDGVTVKGFDIDSPAFGSGIGAFNLTGGATVDRVNILTPDDSGITISNSSGTFTFTNIDITDAGLAAVRVSGGDAVVSVDVVPGSITNTAGRLLEVVNTTGGSVSITGGDITSTGGTGIRVSGNAGSVSVTNAITITNPADTALVVRDNTAAVTLDSLDITTTDQIAIYTTNNTVGTVTLEGTVDATGTTGEANVKLNTSLMSVLFDTLKVNNASGTGGALAVSFLDNASVVEVGYLDAAATGGTVVQGTEHGTLRITDPTSRVVGTGVQAWSTSISEGGGVSTLDVLLGTLSSMSSSGSGAGISAASGSFSATGGSITTPTFNGFNVSSGSADITYGGTITDAAGFAVSVLSMFGGTTTFSGAISQTAVGADGIQLANNTGATLNLTGGMTLSTATSSGLSATGGGTLNVTGTNTITTTTGTPVTITGTTIGASGVTFESVSANGASSGIILSGTGSTGTFTVTGTGATAGTGGTIQNTTGAGVSLTTVDGVVLENMNITDAGLDGISGTTVTDLTVENVSIMDGMGSTGDNHIDIATLNGTSSITSSTIDGGIEANVLITVPSGTLTLDLTGSSFSSSASGDGFNIAVSGTGNATVTADGTTFDLNADDGFEGTSANGSTLTLFSKNATTFSDNSDAGLVLRDIGSVVNFDVRGTTVSGNQNTGVSLISDAASSNTGGLNGTFDGNTLFSADLGWAVDANLQGNAINRIQFTNNTVTTVASDGENGMRVSTGGTSATRLDLIFDGNVFDLSASSFVTMLDITNNNGVTCLDYGASTGNTVMFAVQSSSIGVDANNAGGTFNVEDLATFGNDLVSLLNARTTSTGGGTEATVSGMFSDATSPCQAPMAF